MAGLVSLAGNAPAQTAPQPYVGLFVAPAPISGTATMATSATTLVIDGRLIRLWGIDAGNADDVPSFNKWLQKVAGRLSCEPVAKTGRYKCMTADHHDVAEVALFSGFARVGAGAMNDYHDLEDQARAQHHGLWQQR